MPAISHFKCPNCGGDLIVDQKDVSLVRCPYCGHGSYINDGVSKFDRRLRSITNMFARMDEQSREQSKAAREAMKKSWPLFLGSFLLLVLIMVCSVISSYHSMDEYRQREAEKVQAGYIRAPLGSRDAEGMNYEDVVAQYERAGFTHVSTVRDSINPGSNDVTEIRIDGSRVSSGTVYPPDSNVTITYRPVSDSTHT